MKWFLSMLLIVGCQDIGKRVIKGPEQLLNEEHLEANEVILAAEANPFRDEFPQDVMPWTPTWAEITTSQLLITQAIKEKHPEIMPNLKEYGRQYAGYQNAAGKTLFANFFCRSPETWKTEPVQKEGRDGCYFSMKVDLQKNEIFGFTKYEADTHPDSLPSP